MAFLKFLWALALCIGFWLFGFFIFAGWLGVSAIRGAGWWMPGDRIGRYVTVSSPRLARLLISRYSGYSDRIRTNIPVFYDRYTENTYPDRFSALGVAAACVLGPLIVWFAAEWSWYVWCESGGRGVPAAGISLMVGNMAFYYTSIWNHSRAEEGNVLTKAEYRERKRAERAGRRAERKRKDEER